MNKEYNSYRLVEDYGISEGDDEKGIIEELLSVKWKKKDTILTIVTAIIQSNVPQVSEQQQTVASLLSEEDASAQPHQVAIAMVDPRG